MFDYIKGKVDYIDSKCVVLNHQGIGYQLICPNPFNYQADFHKDTIIYTYHYVREDLMALYGFRTRDEREVFIQLLSVSGIGPKGALAIMASGEPAQIIQAIEEENEKYLTKFPGIGKKTARQIILDLKGKWKGFGGLFAPEETSGSTESNGALEEALLALSALGYSDREIKKITPKLKGQSLTAEAFVKEALRLMLKD